jgi:hypothetical protein
MRRLRIVCALNESVDLFRHLGGFGHLDRNTGLGTKRNDLISRNPRFEDFSVPAGCVVLNNFKQLGEVLPFHCITSCSQALAA